MVGGTREKAFKSSEARGQLHWQMRPFRRCYRYIAPPGSPGHSENWDHLNVASRWRVCPYDLLTSIAQCASGGASPPSRTVLLFITTFVVIEIQLRLNEDRVYHNI